MKTLILLLLVSTPALATPSNLSAFKKEYPGSKAIAKCVLCHEGSPMDGKLNYYGLDYVKYAKDFKAIESIDSDGDTFTNLDEIKANTYPGDRASYPASVPTGN